MKQITLSADELQVIMDALLNTQARISFNAIMIINGKLSSDGTTKPNNKQ